MCVGLKKTENLFCIEQSAISNIYKRRIYFYPIVYNPDEIKVIRSVIKKRARSFDPALTVCLKKLVFHSKIIENKAPYVCIFFYLLRCRFSCTMSCIRIDTD